MLKHKPTFLNQNKPFITCMVQAKNPTEAIAAIRNAAADGADAFGFQICRMEPEYRTKEHLQSIFRHMGNRPIYVTNYRYGFNEGKTDDELAEGLLFELECGATLIDVMGDMFCKDPRELTYDPVAVEKQKKVFPEIMIHMIAAGEASGSLDVAFDRVGKHFEKDSHLKGLVTKSMIYPIILIS